MFTLLWNWLVSFFTADRIGCLVRTLLLKAGTKIAAEILDPQNQKKAYEFVRDLNKRDDLTNWQKAAEFNRRMFQWAKQMHKILKESVVNSLRQLAVNAVKAQVEQLKMKEASSEKKEA